MKWHDCCPEWQCVRGGDPFLRRIVAFDDEISDCQYNRELIGLDAMEAEAVIQRAEGERLAYELSVLYLWFASEAVA